MNNFEDSEFEFAIKLYESGYITGPKACHCGNNSFAIHYDKYSKTLKCIFRCKNTKCKCRYSLRHNSFYSLFTKMKLRLISKIIKCFIEGLNASKCCDKLKN